MRILTENIWWKLLSLALAAVLWFAVVGQADVATTVPVPLHFTNLMPELMLVSDVPDKLFLKITGPPGRLTEAALSEVVVRLDLGRIQGPGEHTFTLSEQNLVLPAGTRLDRVLPSQVRLQIERYTTKLVPVEVRFSGPPPKGYRVASQQVSPGSVRIGGPETNVEAISSLPTDGIDLSSTFSGGTFRVPVFLSDRHVAAEASPMVEVNVTLERIPASNK